MDESQKDKLDNLESTPESAPHQEVTPGRKAKIAATMAKEAVENGNISSESAEKFADSMINDCIVPVTIGTPENPIFPTKTIVEARPLIVKGVRDAATQEGIDFDSKCNERKRLAEKTIAVLEKEYGRQNEKFGPFAQWLTSEQRQEEASKEAERKAIARQILEGNDEIVQLDSDDESLKNFFNTDIPNVYFGNELKGWLESHS